MISGATPPPAEDLAAVEFLAWVDKMERASSALKDGTWVLRQQEYAGGTLQPLTETTVKFRKDGAVYLRWTGDINTGRELLFVPGWNDDRMRVQTGAYVPNVNLTPDSRLATRNQRHTIRDVSIVKTADLVITATRQIVASPTYAPKVTSTGVQTVAGEQAHCYETWTPKDQDPTFYARRVDVCMSSRTNLPVRVTAYDIEDGAMRMIEDYTFQDLEVNPGITAAEFTPDFGDYNF